MVVAISRAADLIGVRRQTLYDKRDRIPRADYFIDTPKGVKIDTDHPDWKVYEERIYEKKNGTVGQRQVRAILTATITILKQMVTKDKDELEKLVSAIMTEYQKIGPE